MASPTQDITFDQIRARAYELWERNHRPDGLEIELWLLAERELRAETKGDNLPSKRTRPDQQSVEAVIQPDEPG